MALNQEEKWLLEEKYKGEETAAYHSDLERLRAGEPLAYVIGHMPFLGCRIYLDSKPLIPRPETEYWVEIAIEAIRKKKNPHVLDLCAGSGAVGVAVAKEIKDAEVFFAEIDINHLATIKKNIEVNLADTNHQVVASDLFNNISGTFDFILSNPPYIDPSLDRTEESVTKYEPHLALYGGKDGLQIIEKIIKESVSRLNKDGQLWIEHEPEQATRIAELAAANGINVSTFSDQYGVSRFSVLVR